MLAADRSLPAVRRALSSPTFPLYVAGFLGPFGGGVIAVLIPQLRDTFDATTGEVAAAMLGSDERLEYTLVGDTVNLSQRLQQWAEPGEIVLSDATHAALTAPCEAEALEPALVKGRHTPVLSYRVRSPGGSP
jgi:hypothetical protein